MAKRVLAPILAISGRKGLKVKYNYGSIELNVEK